MHIFTYVDMKTQIASSIILATTLIPLITTASNTGSSHNLFVLNRLSDNSLFVARANLATRDGLSDTFFGYVDANYRYVLNNNWSLEAGYRHAALELADGWRQEYRPMFALYWRNKTEQIKLSNRNRIELRYFENNAKDRIRYRNETVITSLHQFTRYAFTPYIEQEFFYDITDSKLNVNWLTFGISKFWTKNIKWKLGYRLQSQNFNNEWENRHILVTGISFLHFD